MKLKSVVITIVAFLFILIAGCSSGIEEESMSEVEKEINTQELAESMFSEDNLEAAKERLDERGGSEIFVPASYTSIGENQATIVKLEESDILDGKDSTFEIYDNLGDVRLDSLELDSTFENHDEYTGISVDDLEIGPGYYSEHYNMLWTAGIPTYGVSDLSEGTITFYVKKRSSSVKCYFQGINSEVSEKIIRNIEYADENDIPVIVYGEFEQFLNEEGYPGYRLIIHKIGFKEIID